MPQDPGRVAVHFRIRLIVEEVAKLYHIEPEQIASPSRIPKFAEARMLVYFVARTRFTETASAIARELKRDHSTVVHGIEKAQRIIPNIYGIASMIGDRVDRRIDGETLPPPALRFDTPEQLQQDVEAVLNSMDRSSFHELMLRVMRSRGGSLMIICPEKAS